MLVYNVGWSLAHAFDANCTTNFFGAEFGCYDVAMVIWAAAMALVVLIGMGLHMYQVLLKVEIEVMLMRWLCGGNGFKVV